MIDAVYAKTGIPTSTSLSLSIDALKSLEVRRLVIATPFAPERNEALRRFLEGSGFEVLAIKGLGITRNMDSTRLSSDASYRLAVEVFRKAKGAEGIYIPCPRWPVVRHIDPLERDLGVPVVSHIQAMTWWGLKSLGIKEQIKGYGTLLERLVD